ncbi:AAA family ATPase [Geopsychrobacter electrodiphilus]|uniref:AAA family ATPase n=1 Tax=Geopsychrobacter electrodiphilus TaxID=225196 RepID=UPI00035F238C|nr:SMC family ATPase [Geopsychrobacter electrodiphilus]
MRILSIQLKNIKSHTETSLDFSAGINVLSGPNGIGKSTIFEAIGYAMFGVDAQSFVGNIERFIRIGAKKGEVSISFESCAGELFRVSRSVGTASKWLLAREVGGAFEVEEHKDARETETRLKGLLGLEKNGRSLAEQFELVIGPFQHDFLGPFVIKQPAKRRDRFDEILGIDAWRTTFTRTNELLKAIKARVDVLQSAIGPLKDQVASLPEKRAEQQQIQLNRQQTQTRLASSQQQLKNLETQLTDVDRYEQSLKSQAVEIETLKGRIVNGTEKIGEQKRLLGEAEKAARVIVETTAGKLAFEQAETRLAQLREQSKLQRQLEQQLAALDKQIGSVSGRFAAESAAIVQTRDELNAEEQNLAETRKLLAIDQALQQGADRLPELRTAIDGLRKQLGQLEGRRAGLEEGSEKLAAGVCPFFQEPCLNIAENPPQDVFSAKFVELADQRQLLNVELKKLESDEEIARKASDQVKEIEVGIKSLDQQGARLLTRRKINEDKAQGLQVLQAEQVALQTQLVEKQQALRTYSSLQADIEAAEVQKQEHQPARDLYVAHLKLAEELEQRTTDLHKFEQLFIKLQADLRAKEHAYTQAEKGYDADRHQELRRQKDALGLEVGALGQQVKGIEADLTRLAREIDKLKQLEQEIAAKQLEIKAYAEKDELVKFLRHRVFRNVSAALSERFREEISLRADKIYRTISETDEELYWGENYQIVLRDMADGEIRERVNDQLSGGQTMSAVVALRLAMLQTIGARIAFFDEPTSNLDATRRENLARAFRSIDVGKEEVTEHWYDQLFLISHDVAFTEVTDQIIHLEERLSSAS